LLNFTQVQVLQSDVYLSKSTKVLELSIKSTRVHFLNIALLLLQCLHLWTETSYMELWQMLMLLPWRM